MYLVELKIIVDPVPQQSEGMCIALGANVLHCVDRSSIRADIGHLLTEDLFSVGKSLLEQVVRDLEKSVSCSPTQ